MRHGTTDRFSFEKKVTKLVYETRVSEPFNRNVVTAETTAPSAVSGRNQSENRQEVELVPHLLVTELGDNFPGVMKQIAEMAIFSTETY
jgi:hypothetical protein